MAAMLSFLFDWDLFEFVKSARIVKIFSIKRLLLLFGLYFLLESKVLLFL